jgi:hypothetical protein
MIRDALLKRKAKDALYTPHKRTFHRFSDLPAELRCRIYEEYFCDNYETLACMIWSGVEWRYRRHAPRSTGTGRLLRLLPYSNDGESFITQPLLLSLCFMDRTFGREATSLLLETINCGMMGHSEVKAFMEKLLARLKLDLMNRIRKISFYIQYPTKNYDQLVHESDHTSQVKVMRE